MPTSNRQVSMFGDFQTNSGSESFRLHPAKRTALGPGASELMW